jgi:hypothetical protein
MAVGAVVAVGCGVGDAVGDAADATAVKVEATTVWSGPTSTSLVRLQAKPTKSMDANAATAARLASC